MALLRAFTSIVPNSARIITPGITFGCRRSSTYTENLRSELCGRIGATCVGNEVSLCGWLHKKRLDKFWVLRDWTGTVQVFFDDASGVKLPAEAVPHESVIRVRGVVRPRPLDQQRSDSHTGVVEVHATNVEVLNAVKGSLPFSPLDRKVSEPVRLFHRYLDFRTTSMQANLRLRSTLMMKMRQFLHDHNEFVDVETPYLFRRTPGGAREFLVPSQQYGKFYSLTQSPQQFKQLLMVGGIDRYFQIARCFRDETNNPEKQPEFTQLDMEMSFIDMDSIMRLIENLVAFSWPAQLGDPPAQPFPRMTYQDAMNFYGTDKPDTRFELKFRDLTAFSRTNGLFSALLEDPATTARAFVAPQGGQFCRSKFQKLMQVLIQQEHPGVALAFIRVDESGKIAATKLTAEVQAGLLEATGASANDLVVICVGKGEACLKALGRVRLETADQLQANGQEVRAKDKKFEFLWVVDFPLFEATTDPTTGTTTWSSAHHPFTAPMPEDAALLNQPDRLSEIRGQHYDLVLNGSEVGGGSIRVHSGEMQRHILSLLKIDPTELNHLLTALDSGCPPHGGIALGLDRLVSIYAGTTSIRDVIAFPKTTSGNDLMGSAPCRVPKDQLDFYNIACTRNPSAVDARDDVIVKAKRSVGV
ncbi:Aspartate--tRNA ligase, mitochondrial [Hypsibius exemplaris]|uniref:Aspartate--tRNA ligase, mitochondrial n=1 Tax=Hypsibius exemplaris TaxID=2072580 RepID=A0A1W0X7Z6_HYPEX|nr:Aspartate--tRNA ligase, mitochondrial [Hypsibius exemplaris]